MEKEILEEKERVIKECFKTIEHILKDKREGKVKNKSYPIRKICVILYYLYGMKEQDIRRKLKF